MTSHKLFVKILCGIAILPLLACSQGCAKLPHQGLLPADVVGTWTTKDPRYQDRELELSRAFVILITGRHDPASVQMIDRVESNSDGPDTLFTIYSTDYSQGTHFEMKIQFRPENGGEIRFKNQPALWTRRVEAKDNPKPR